MAGDRHHNEEFDLRIRYSQEVSEKLRPEQGISYPVQGPGDFGKVEKWRVDRAYIFLCVTTIICMGALIWCPSPVTQAAVASIWASSATLTRYLLKHAYPTSTSRKRKAPPP